MKEFSELYTKQLDTTPEQEDKLRLIGKKNAKEELKEMSEQQCEETVVEVFNTMLKTVAF